MGNSQGVLIPKPVFAQLGLESEVDMTVEGDALVIRKPKQKVRNGWAEASQKVADSGDDVLVMGMFRNTKDKETVW